MNHSEIQKIATDNGLGKVHFQFNTAQNTGRLFEVGYVSVGKTRELFCKRSPDSNPDQFYLCNDYAKLANAPAPTKFQMRTIQANGATYFRAEDVGAFLREIAATEETDVRNRLTQAAVNLLK